MNMKIENLMMNEKIMKLLKLLEKDLVLFQESDSDDKLGTWIQR